MRLDNGLELIVLEEHALPVVSVQMLYRTGARDEDSGRTGLAHYLEHMAFRATEHFPARSYEPDLRRRRRVARLHLDRPDDLLRDRCRRSSSTSCCASSPTAWATCSSPRRAWRRRRGAVLAELHGYENDQAPSSTMRPCYASLPGASLSQQHDRLGERRRAHQRAISCASTASTTRRRTPCSSSSATSSPKTCASAGGRAVRGLSGDAADATAGHDRADAARRAPREPRGRRRRELLRFRLSRARRRQHRLPRLPAHAGDPRRWRRRELRPGPGRKRRAGRLAAPRRSPTTWRPGCRRRQRPTSSRSRAASRPTWNALRSRRRSKRAHRVLRDEAVSERRVDVARQRVLSDLVFDVETTEDAARQLAFYAGLDALGSFLGWPDAIARSRRRSRCAMSRRAICSRASAPSAGITPAGAHGRRDRGVAAPKRRCRSRRRRRSPEDVKPTPPPPPVLLRLRNGVPAIVQRIALSPACYVRVLVPSRHGRDRRRRVDRHLRVGHDLGSACARPPRTSPRRSARRARPLPARGLASPTRRGRRADPEARLRARAARAARRAGAEAGA